MLGLPINDRLVHPAGEYHANLFRKDYNKNLFSEDYATRSQPWTRKWAQFMTPNPGPVVEPELKEVNKVETKSVLNTESVT